MRGEMVSPARMVDVAEVLQAARRGRNRRAGRKSRRRRGTLAGESSRFLLQQRGRRSKWQALAGTLMPADELGTIAEEEGAGATAEPPSAALAPDAEPGQDGADVSVARRRFPAARPQSKLRIAGHTVGMLAKTLSDRRMYGPESLQVDETKLQRMLQQRRSADVGTPRWYIIHPDAALKQVWDLTRACGGRGGVGGER